MSKFDCSRQSELVARIRGGSIDDDIQAHLDGCGECGEVARVIAGLAPLAAAPRGVPPFADLFWRAQARDILGASSRRSLRAVRPLYLFHGAIGIGMIAVALLLAIGPLIVPLSADLVMGGPLVVLTMAAIGGLTLVSGTRGYGRLPEFDR